MNPTSDDWIKSSLSSFPTHQHRYASMERMRQADGDIEKHDVKTTSISQISSARRIRGGHSAVTYQTEFQLPSTL